MWIGKSMRAALTKSKIQSGFRATCIWPLDATAIDHRYQPAEQFHYEQEEGSAGKSGNEQDENPNLYEGWYQWWDPTRN